MIKSQEMTHLMNGGEPKASIAFHLPRIMRAEFPDLSVIENHICLNDRLIEETVTHYPNRDRMRSAPDVFLEHPLWHVRLARSIDMRRSRARKPSSKYGLARRLKKAVLAL